MAEQVLGRLRGPMESKYNLGQTRLGANVSVFGKLAMLKSVMISKSIPKKSNQDISVF